MWRSVSPEHFRESVRSAKSPGEYGTWLVGDRYELVEDFIVDRSEDHVDYRPIEEVPDLFFKFAKLHKSPDFERDALAWISRYGFPSNAGLVDNPKHRETYGPLRVEDPRDEVPMPPPEVLDKLYKEIVYGDVLSLDWLRNKVEDAWLTLERYEVALNADAEKARTLTIDSFPDSFPYNDEEMEQMKAEGIDEDDVFLDVALIAVEVDVDSKLKENPCFPEIRTTGDDFPANPSQLTQYWRFQNLIGAMYLQMMWVMTSGAHLARCKFCNLPISTRSPKGRASRPDKRFCNDSCRQAYHRSRRNGKR